MPLTDLLIGSYPHLEEQTMAVSTAGPVTEDCDVAAGAYYLFDDFSPFDLFAVVANSLMTHSVLNDVALVLGVDLHVNISSSIAFSLNWADATILRDLLGFTVNLTSNTVHRAPRISPLLWSPGRTTTTEARLGTDGIPVRDVARGQSGPSTLRSTSFNRYRRNRLIYRYLLNSRVWTESESNGEFFTFYDQVLIEARRFKLWRNYPEDLSDSTTLQNPNDSSDPGPLPSEGAYVYTGPTEMPWGREFGFVDATHPIEIPVVTTREYDAP